jgi:hypothetical protein
MNDDILNTGLHLAMEWGEDWLKPIQTRLSKQYPELSLQQMDEYDAVCRKAMHFGHNLIYELHSTQSLSVSSTQSQFEMEMKKAYPWVSGENLGRLFSQGMYYAMK